MTSEEPRHTPIGDRLRQLRTSRGLTQEELAERVLGGVSVDTISNIERGRVRPRRHTLLGMLDALGIEQTERERLLTKWRTRPGAEAQAVAGPSRALPSPLTPLIGREKELAALVSMLRNQSVRIVTLTGPGGVGKTRLALAAANEVRADLSDGCMFLDLTPLRDPSQLLATIAFGLGLPDFGDRPALERLIAYLRPKNVLLILDNSETAVEASAQLSPVVEACDGVTLLATSREPLRLHGEHESSVPPLALPGPREAHSPEELSRVPSVELLLQRARMVSPELTLTPANAAAIAQICSRLDGLPLALELAGARLKHLAPEALVTRLDRALSVLVDGPRDLPERQRTLRATIDWSHALLTEAEQRLLRRLSVFVDGCTATAISHVCRDDATDWDESVLDGLLDKNLLTVLRGSPASEPRFGMLETIREYAAERLRDSGEESSLRDRHAGFFRDLADTSFPELYSERRSPWLEALRLEHGNVLAALSWCLQEDGDRETGLRMASALGRFWYFTGHLNEGRAWLAWALEIAELNRSSAYGRTLYSAGKIAWVQGDFTSAVSHAEQSVVVASEGRDQLFLAECLTLFGYCLVSLGRSTEAIAAYRQSLELERKLGARWQVAFTLAMASEAARLEGDLETAEQYVEEALMTFRGLSDPWGQGVALAMTAGVRQEQGDLATMEVYLDRAEAAFKEFGEDKYSTTRLTLIRGYVNLKMGRLDHAASHFTEALTLAQELGQTAYILVAVGGAGSVAACHGRARTAAMLSAYASPLLEPGAMRVDDGGAAARDAYAQLLPLLKGQLGEDFDKCWKDGQLLSLHEAVELARSALQETLPATR